MGMLSAGRFRIIDTSSARVGRRPRTGPETERGFLLNHLISDELQSAEGRISNSDPITGQAGWYDVRVRIYPSAEEGAFPEFATLEHSYS